VSDVRGRRLTAFLAAGLLALAAGCGSDDSLAPEVPGPPADVVLPESTVAPAADEDADADAEATPEATDEDAPADEGTTAPEETAPSDDTGAAAPETDGGGTAAPETEADSPTNDTPPPEDSEAEQFEDFCAQNPGAC
jgi:hypothetical protein